MLLGNSSKYWGVKNLPSLHYPVLSCYNKLLSSFRLSSVLIVAVITVNYNNELPKVAVTLIGHINKINKSCLLSLRRMIEYPRDV